MSSRKQENVEKAVESLRGEVGNLVEGIVCHVGKEEDRKRLVKEVGAPAFYCVVHQICPFLPYNCYMHYACLRGEYVM